MSSGDELFAIEPAVLGTGLCTFALCLAVHVLYWRWAKPRAHILLLLVIFFALPTTLAFLGAARLSTWLGSGRQALALTLLHWALAAAYVQSFPAAQARSPSLAILLALGEAGASGLTEQDIRDRASADSLSLRITDLTADGLVSVSDQRLCLSRAGRLLAVAFRALRRGISPAGGGEG
jgi:hypothetical protein